MEVFRLLSPVFPVFLLVAVGYVFAHWKRSPYIGDGNYRLFGNSFLGFHLLASRSLALDIAVLFSGVVIIFAPKLLDP